jgi:hypothetical protein
VVSGGFRTQNKSLNKSPDEAPMPVNAKPAPPCFWCGKPLPAEHDHVHLEDSSAACLCRPCRELIARAPDQQAALRGLFELWRDLAPSRTRKEH